MTTLPELLEQRPKLRYIFTGGKGGVGKTVAAAGLAYHCASQGESVLVASLNPVHSLSSLFGQSLSGGKVIEVRGAKNVHAVEVETTEVVERYRNSIRGRVKEFLKWADIPLDAKPFIEIAATNPAFEESAMFDRMVDYILKEGEAYDRVIFDTAAVANAVRLIGLSKIYGLWLTRMIDSRKEALSMRVQLSFRKEKVMAEVKKDPLMADLISMNERFEKAKGVLVDPERTAFFFVTLPLALPIAVVRRFIGMVQKFSIPIGGVIVNEVLRPEVALQDGAGEYLANKYHEQIAYMKVLYRDLGPLVRSYIPLYSSEVTGVDMVRRVSEDMMTYTPPFAAELTGAA
ncbi:MAG TPA: ArsA family ATPase [Thermoplasmata archaeon]|nr:ArsA family ATPase [Thermoplasmata archaeon]